MARQSEIILRIRSTLLPLSPMFSLALILIFRAVSPVASSALRRREVGMRIREGHLGRVVDCRGESCLISINISILGFLSSSGAVLIGRIWRAGISMLQPDYLVTTVTNLVRYPFRAFAVFCWHFSMLEMMYDML